MDQVSRPLLIVLVVAAAFLALWLVALKPHGSSTSSPPASKPAQVSPPAAAKPPSPRPTQRAAAVPKPVHRPRPAGRLAQASKPAVRPSASAQSGASTRLGEVQYALARGHVLALLFYNPAAADDQAVKQELAGVPAHGARVFTLAVPLPEVSSYAALTNQVPVNVSPTLVIIDRGRHAQEIVGFADSFEIAQRLQDALAVPVAAG
jgi:hypothetical protein